MGGCGASSGLGHGRVPGDARTPARGVGSVCHCPGSYRKVSAHCVIPRRADEFRWPTTARAALHLPAQRAISGHFGRHFRPCSALQF
ncbi:hypothetical protein DB31_8153 [Hyalangium minutum]|uniref:Uncharacterized protein n=1 Tax=Hyalangium minutum TaxID=394096 RepID=A0A085WJ07_9BACT|nr:hypothetical protein DB31_8153 [Hyalangium minutum]